MKAEALRFERYDTPPSPEPYNEEELRPLYEHARDLNLIVPQMFEGVVTGELLDLLTKKDPVEAVVRYAATSLPETFAADYAKRGNDAHAAKGIDRVLSARNGAWLWEREKLLLLSFVASAVCKGSELQDLKIFDEDTAVYYQAFTLLHEQLYHTDHPSVEIAQRARMEDVAINTEYLARLTSVLRTRMKEQPEKIAELKAFAEAVQTAIKEMPEALTRYRNEFAVIYTRYRDHKDMQQFRDELNAHSDAMRRAILNHAAGVATKKDLDSARSVLGFIGRII